MSELGNKHNWISNLHIPKKTSTQVFYLPLVFLTHSSFLSQRQKSRKSKNCSSLHRKLNYQTQLRPLKHFVTLMWFSPRCSQIAFHSYISCILHQDRRKYKWPEFSFLTLLKIVSHPWISEKHSLPFLIILMSIILNQ